VRDVEVVGQERPQQVGVPVLDPGVAEAGALQVYVGTAGGQSAQRAAGSTEHGTGLFD